MRPAKEPDAIAVCIPYAGEGIDRLRRTVDSADRTRAKIRVVQEDHGRIGLPKTLNRAVRVAADKGATHVCWLSTGDTLEPDRFALRHGPVPTDKGQFCRVMVESRGHVVPEDKVTPQWSRKIYRDNVFCLTGAVIPVSVWMAIGGMNEDLTYCSDWELAMRIEHFFGWECMDRVLATANEYPGGITLGADQEHRQRDRSAVRKLGNLLKKGRGSQNDDM